MAHNVCITLAFNKKVRQSHREKVKEFWAFLDTETKLKPYTGKPTPKPSVKVEESDDEFPTLTKNIWFDQLQVFQEYKLDNVALATTKTCKICDESNKYRPTEFADTVKESYDQLLKDIKVYDDKLRSKVEVGTGLDKKRSIIS